MLELDALSPLGFGCYRLSSPPHAAALEEALRSGCNLVDTASTYTDGRSECLIGAVMAANPDIDAFVVTKAGYGEGQGGGAAYSLDPDFLAARLDRSLDRLRRPMVDALLLHNPEHLLNQGVGELELSTQLAAAFAFLEACVANGRLRYFGISSNVLATPSVLALSLEGYLALANQIRADHHFRLVQFPCNLLERTAIQGAAGASLVAQARARGVITLANRPLNALLQGELVRLATYDEDRVEAGDDAVVMACLEAIGKQLRKTASSDGPLDFEPVRYVANHWAELDSTDSVDHLFGLLSAFLRRLYGGAIPDADAMLFDRLYNQALHHARRRLNNRAAAARRKLTADCVIPEADDRPLQMVACEFLLSAGLDHVLVGMRNTAYVRDLQYLFNLR